MKGNNFNLCRACGRRIPVRVQRCSRCKNENPQQAATGRGNVLNLSPCQESGQRSLSKEKQRLCKYIP
jgi:hypothetical protein